MNTNTSKNTNTGIKRHIIAAALAMLVGAALSGCSTINKAEDAALSGGLQDQAFVAVVDGVHRELATIVAMRTAGSAGASTAPTNADWMELFTGGAIPSGVKIEFLVAASFVTVWENDALVPRNAEMDKVVTMIQFSRGTTAIGSAAACFVPGTTYAEDHITAGACKF